MFDQHTEETLHTAEQGTMYHVWTMRLSILSNEFEFKPFRKVEIKLDCGELPFAIQGVIDLQVNLWPVKGTTAFVHFIRQLMHINGTAKGFGGFIPICWVPHVFFRARGEIGFEVL